MWTTDGAAQINDEITYTFEKEENVQEAVLIFDSEFTRNGSWKEHHPLNMPNFYPLEGGHYHVPDCMVKGFELKREKGWRMVYHSENT